eukprot:6761644-Prymnesium_polylepis.1
MNVLPLCTGCDSGRCLVQPTLALRETPGAGWAFRPGANPFARVECLSSRVWLVVEDDRFNEHPFLYVIVGAARVVCIDTGVGTADYGDWLAAFLAAHCGPEAASLPLLVVNTHCHYDHVGGNASLAPRAEICASAHDPDFTRAALDPVRDASLAVEVGCVELRPYEVTRWLQDGELIALSDGGADDSLQVLHLPGHTPDSLALWLLPEHICFVGDTLYPYASVIVSNRDSSLARYLESLTKLEALLAVANGRPKAAGGDAAPQDDAPRVRLACGHVDAELPASSLAEMIALVRDVVSGSERPARPPARTGWEGVHFFERGTLCLSVRRDDPALAVAERREPR